MSNERQHNGYFVLAILFLVALYVTDLVIRPKAMTYPGPLFISKFADTSLWYSWNIPSIVAAILLLTGTALALTRIANRYSSGFTFFIPIAYLAITLCNPGSAMLTPFHFAALLLVPSLHFYFHYGVAEQNVSHLFVSGFLLDMAVCFCPPVIWLAPVLMLTGLGFSEEKAKYLVACLLSITLPLIMAASVVYLTLGLDEAVSVFPDLLARATDAGIGHIHLTMAAVCRIVAISVIAIYGTLTVFRNLGGYKIAKYQVYTRLAIIMLALVAISIVFAGDTDRPWSILTAMPAVLLTNELFNADNRVGSKHTGTLILIAVLVIAVERTIYFIR